MIKSVFLASALLVSSSMTAYAQDSAAEWSAETAAQFGPAVGTMAPAISATDADGAAQNFSSLSGENGLVVYFNRSLDWCPICVRQTLEVEAAADQFAEAGWGLAVVSRDDVATLERAKFRHEFSIPLLADADSALIDVFDIRDPVYADPAHRAHGVPYPMAFAINSDGEIVEKFWHEAGLGDQRGYATRVSAEDVLNALGES